MLSPCAELPRTNASGYAFSAVVSAFSRYAVDLKLEYHVCSAALDLSLGRARQPRPAGSVFIGCRHQPGPGRRHADLGKFPGIRRQPSHHRPISFRRHASRTLDLRLALRFRRRPASSPPLAAFTPASGSGGDRSFCRRASPCRCRDAPHAAPDRGNCPNPPCRDPPPLPEPATR